MDEARAATTARAWDCFSFRSAAFGRSAVVAAGKAGVAIDDEALD
jgi:hypothetical protein